MIKVDSELSISSVSRKLRIHGNVFTESKLHGSWSGPLVNRYEERSITLFTRITGFHWSFRFPIITQRPYISTKPK